MRKLFTLLSLCILSIMLTTAFTSTSVMSESSAEITLAWDISGDGAITICINGSPIISACGAGSTTVDIASIDPFVELYAQPGYIMYDTDLTPSYSGGYLSKLTVTGICVRDI